MTAVRKQKKKPPFADLPAATVAGLGERPRNWDVTAQSFRTFQRRSRAGCTPDGPDAKRESNHVSHEPFFQLHGSKVGTGGDDGVTSEDWNAKHESSLPDLGGFDCLSGDDGVTSGGPNASQTVALPDLGGFGGLDGAQVHQSVVNGGVTSPECSFLVRYVTGGVDVDPSSGPESG